MIPRVLFRLKRICVMSVRRTYGSVMILTNIRVCAGMSRQSSYPVGSAVVYGYGYYLNNIRRIPETKQ